MTIESILSYIRPADRSAEKAARGHWDSLAKPLGSLGRLEDAVTKIAALTGDPDVLLHRRDLVVFCADNGVVRRGVSQTDHTATTAVAAALGEGTSTVNYMARAAACAVLPVDIGMREDTPAGVLPRKVRRETADISAGPAMTRAECETAILAGVRIAGGFAGAIYDEGLGLKEFPDGEVVPSDILLLGEMGIGNTTTTAAVTCALLSRPPEEIAGYGAGLSEEGLKRKIAVIREALAINQPDSNDPIDILQKVGGLDLAALCGVCLGAALYRIPVILDGAITNAAALCAVRMCPAVRDALIASHISREPAADLLLDALGLSPCIQADLHLGEGSGAVMMLSLLDQALAVYSSGHTFGHLGIPAYTPQ